MTSGGEAYHIEFLSNSEHVMTLQVSKSAIENRANQNNFSIDYWRFFPYKYFSHSTSTSTSTSTSVTQNMSWTYITSVEKCNWVISIIEGFPLNKTENLSVYKCEPKLL